MIRPSKSKMTLNEPLNFWYILAYKHINMEIHKQSYILNDINKMRHLKRF